MKALHQLTKDADEAVEPVDPSNCMIIEDGNAFFHSNIVVHSSPLIFSTDMYNEDSVKSGERLRRGCGEKLIVSGECTIKPKDWKAFLTSDANKKQLVQVLLRTWCSDLSADLLHGYDVTLICEGEGLALSPDGKKTLCLKAPSLKSTQEEADSSVVLYCLHAMDSGFKVVKVRSPDTDIFFILLHYANILHGLGIIFQTGEGTKKRCFGDG